MIAILSDIHANLEALEAVLADIEQFKVEAIYCLGDLVGYGPDPIACLQLARKWSVVLLGNHDAAMLSENQLDGYSALALRRSLLNCRDTLKHHPDGPRISLFLWNCPSSIVRGKCLYVHGSPRESLHEYIFPEDIYNDGKMSALMSRFEHICFCGHTHLPGIFRTAEPKPQKPQPWSFFRREELPPPKWDHLTPEECGHEYPLSGEKLICNVGSVGQPRDNDPRAGYVLYSPELIRFRRVKYDVEKTIRKIYDGPDDNMLGDRLLTGR
jgi:predicted phosphodiesterase